MSVPPFTDPVLLKEFMLAGRATLTIRSEKTGKHFTYKITRPRTVQDRSRLAPESTKVRFVSYLGSENKYYYLANIDENERFVPTRRTPFILCPSDQMVAFRFFWEHLVNKCEIHPGITAYHDSKCASCGIKLTDPISIKEGFGPECRKKRLRRPS